MTVLIQIIIVCYIIILIIFVPNKYKTIKFAYE